MMNAIEVATKDKLWVKSVRGDFMEEMNFKFSVILCSAYYVRGTVLNIDGTKLSETGPLPRWYDKHINRSSQCSIVIISLNIYGITYRVPSTEDRAVEKADMISST